MIELHELATGPTTLTLFMDAGLGSGNESFFLGESPCNDNSGGMRLVRWLTQFPAGTDTSSYVAPPSAEKLCALVSRGVGKHPAVKKMATGFSNKKSVGSNSGIEQSSMQWQPSQASCKMTSTSSRNQ